jgi:putative ATP-dependent endonuclease of OLD family
MYIAELKLWNFRRYGKADWDLNKPHLIVPFQKGLNVLIGENDSGKTAILDAIKLVLKTHAYEWIRVEESDFYLQSNKLRIEITIKDLNTDEASHFTEWLSWQEESAEAKPILRLIYEAEKKAGRILTNEVKAGADNAGRSLDAEAKEYLKSTYLKALRDADNELVAKKNSRLSQILFAHDLFSSVAGEAH